MPPCPRPLTPSQVAYLDAFDRYLKAAKAPDAIATYTERRQRLLDVLDEAGIPYGQVCAPAWRRN